MLDLGLARDLAPAGAVGVYGLLVETGRMVVLGDDDLLVSVLVAVSREVRVTVTDHLLKLRQVILRRTVMTAVHFGASITLPEALDQLELLLVLVAQESQRPVQLLLLRVD